MMGLEKPFMKDKQRDKATVTNAACHFGVFITICSTTVELSLALFLHFSQISNRLIEKIENGVNK